MFGVVCWRLPSVANGVKWLVEVDGECEKHRLDYLRRSCCERWRLSINLGICWRFFRFAGRPFKKSHFSCGWHYCRHHCHLARVGGGQTDQDYEQGQITERFTRAVEQLGDDNAYMRMGAIQALRLIGSDSENHVLAVLHLLASFVREKSPAKKEGDIGFSPQQKKAIPRNEQEMRVFSIVESVFECFPGEQRVSHIPGDVQESIVAIGKLAEKYETFLMEMEKAHLDLSQSDLAYLRPIMECSFSRCMFMRSDIRGVAFIHCNFRMALFHSAELYAVRFSDCDCSAASFDSAYLNYVVFNRANIAMASFKSAFCNGTDFSTAKNITTEMLKDIKYDAETPPIAPKGVKLPPPRKKET